MACKLIKLKLLIQVDKKLHFGKTLESVRVIYIFYGKKKTKIFYGK